MNANLCSSGACSPGPCPRRDMPCGLRTLLPASPSPSTFCSVPPPPAPTGGHRWGRAGTGPPSPSSWPRLLLSPVENSHLPDGQQWAGRPDHGARAAAAGHTSPSSSTSDSKLGSELKNGWPDPDGFLEEVASGSCSDNRDPGRVAGRTEPVVPARSVKGASAQARGLGSRWRVTAGGAGGAPANGQGAGLSSRLRHPVLSPPRPRHCHSRGSDVCPSPGVCVQPQAQVIRQACRVCQQLGPPWSPGLRQLQPSHLPAPGGPLRAQRWRRLLAPSPAFFGPVQHFPQFARRWAVAWHRWAKTEPNPEPRAYSPPAPSLPPFRGASVCQPGPPCHFSVSLTASLLIPLGLGSRTCLTVLCPPPHRGDPGGLGGLGAGSSPTLRTLPSASAPSRTLQWP